ncbi:MAG: hypothetical protein ABEJ03_01215 [Candidatus Nanohaloarchaea archaeon]
MNETIDRSLDHEETVKVEVESRVYRVPEGSTIRGVAAHLLTPELAGEVEEVLRRIHESAEEAYREETELGFDILVNGQQADFDEKLVGEETFSIEIE